MAGSGHSDADQAEVLVAGSDPPALRIGYSRAFSLYQIVLALATGRQEADLGLTPDVRWRAAAARVEDLHSPLGPFAYFEPSMIRAVSVEGFGQALSARAERFAAELTQGVATVDDLYSAGAWPSHRDLVADALHELVAMLEPRKDDLVRRLCQLFEVRSPPRECAVTLVPVCHVRQGGYSHPTVLDVRVFRGSQLLESLVHELTHVLCASVPRGETSAHAVFRDAVLRHGGSEQLTSDLFHLVIFSASARLVGSAGLREHDPVGRRRGVYALVGRRHGLHVDPDTIDRVLARWEDGTIEASAAFVELAADLLDPPRDQ